MGLVHHLTKDHAFVKSLFNDGINVENHTFLSSRVVSNRRIYKKKAYMLFSLR